MVLISTAAEFTARLGEVSRCQQVTPQLITCQYDVSAPLATESNRQVLNLLTLEANDHGIGYAEWSHSIGTAVVQMFKEKRPKDDD